MRGCCRLRPLRPRSWSQQARCMPRRASRQPCKGLPPCTTHLGLQGQGPRRRGTPSQVRGRPPSETLPANLQTCKGLHTSSCRLRRQAPRKTRTAHPRGTLFGVRQRGRERATCPCTTRIGLQGPGSQGRGALFGVALSRTRQGQPLRQSSQAWRIRTSCKARNAHPWGAARPGMLRGAATRGGQPLCTAIQRVKISKRPSCKTHPRGAARRGVLRLSSTPPGILPNGTSFIRMIS
jgi:hypothetical protein